VAPRDDRHRRRLRPKSIAFQVNGHTVKKLTHPKRGALVKLAAPDNLPITVTAKVKLRTGKTPPRARAISSAPDLNGSHGKPGGRTGRAMCDPRFPMFTWETRDW